MLQKQGFQGAPPRLRVRAPEPHAVVSRNGQIAVIHDIAPPRLELHVQPVPTPVTARRVMRRSTRTAAMWVLGVAEGALLVSGVAVLLSCRFVSDAATATARSYLGIALVFTAAVVTVPAAALMGGRAERAGGHRYLGRHRRLR